MPRQDYAELITGKPTRAQTSASSDVGDDMSRSTSATDETDTPPSTQKPTMFKSPFMGIKLTDASKYVLLFEGRKRKKKKRQPILEGIRLTA